MSGQQLCTAGREVHSAHTVQTSGSACITHLEPQHQKQLSTGTTAKMRRHQSRCWLAAALRLNGSAQLAITSGRRPLQSALARSQVALGAVSEERVTRHSPRLLKLSLHHWLSGTMSAMRPRASIHTMSLLAVTCWCTGCVHAVQEGSHTTGQQCLVIVSPMAVDVQSVLAGKLVYAIHWHLWFRLLQLSLTWTRTAAQLLR